MREELLKKVTSLEDTIMIYKDKLESANQQRQEMERRKDQQIALKEAEISEQKNKMEEMAHEFGQVSTQTCSVIKSTSKHLLTRVFIVFLFCSVL